MFNNNNYLPDLNHYPPTGQMSNPVPNISPPDPVIPVPSPVLPGGFGYARGGNFRFLSPTQVTAAPTWGPATYTVGAASAPGVGANWQHSIPSPMPWANHTAPHFTAQSTISQTQPVYAMQTPVSPQTTTMQSSPKMSVLQRHKRPLQPTPAELSDGPVAKKYLSERMAACFKELYITRSEEQNGTHTGGVGNSGDSSLSFSQDNGWQRFHAVEKRLEVDEATMIMEEKMEAVDLAKPRKKGVLTIPREVKKEANKPNHVLPDVIVKSITNPCTDLVLYTPPEALITGSLSEPSCSTPSVTSTTSSNRSAINCKITTTTSWPQNQASASGNTFTFFSARKSQLGGEAADTEMFDSVDDDMDL